MFTTESDVKDLESKFGEPVSCSWEFEIAPGEYDMVISSMRDGRAHDVTLFIRKGDDPDRFAVIRKPFFPPDAFRAPSGAAHRGESLEVGGLREGHEETGLDIELRRYVVRIKARFTCEMRRPIEWTTHILEAEQVGGDLDPIDTGEIAEARWATIDELQGPFRHELLETGWDLFRYRVALTDLTVGAMGVET